MLDDEPRERLRDEHIDFLQELSAPGMDYLVSPRESGAYSSVERRISRESTAGAGEMTRSASSSPMSVANWRLLRRPMGIQINDSRLKENIRPERKVQKAKVMKVHQSNKVDPVHKFKTEENDSNDTNEKMEKNHQRPRLSPTTSQLQKSLAPSNVQSVLNRASCLMYQALDVEGPMLIDASVYTRRQM